jgi:catechol 2,3-dioxygenase-like lactoylglutathione lyase family enzyme
MCSLPVGEGPVTICLDRGRLPKSSFSQVRELHHGHRWMADDSGLHICLRAPDVPSVDAFHAAALKAGGASDGDPGARMQYDEGYYAAFIRDPDGNRIEAVRFLRSRV